MLVKWLIFFWSTSITDFWPPATSLGSRPRQGMPRGHDPGAVLAKRPIPVRMVQLPGSTLSADLLKCGFVKMGADGRRLWQNDINNKVFKFELIASTNTQAEMEGDDMSDRFINNDSQGWSLLFNPN